MMLLIFYRGSYQEQCWSHKSTVVAGADCSLVCPATRSRLPARWHAEFPLQYGVLIDWSCQPDLQRCFWAHSCDMVVCPNRGLDAKGSFHCSALVSNLQTSRWDCCCWFEHPSSSGLVVSCNTAFWETPCLHMDIYLKEIPGTFLCRGQYSLNPSYKENNNGNIFHRCRAPKGNQAHFQKIGPILLWQKNP